MLLSAVVVADQRAHSLHDAVCGQIKKGLELIVDAQHRDVALGEGCQQTVQEGDEQGGQGQIQDGRNADGVELAVQYGVGAEMLAAQPDRKVGGGIAGEVDAEGDELAEIGGQRRTRDAQCGHRAEAEDQHRVQHDITDAARDQGSHGGLHPANGLKHLLKGKVCHVDDGEQEDDGGVEHTHRDEGLVGGEAAQEARHDGNADQGAEQTVQHRKRHAVRG